MGLQCSILGHSFESAGVEREREEQDSEVVTTEREIERCRRCGTERVVSESTEVTAIVDGEAVDLETDPDSGQVSDTDPSVDPASEPDDGPGTDPSSTSDESPTGDALGGIVDRSGVDDADDGESADGPSPTDGAPSTDTGGEILSDSSDADGSPSGAGDPAPSPTVADDDPLADDPDPTEEDAEILTDDGDSEREPGEWPEESDAGDENAEPADVREPTPEPDGSDAADPEPAVGADADESLSGITVPDGEIVCSDCGFRVDAQSGYRAGDPCPDCAAWLEAERNQ